MKLSQAYLSNCNNLYQHMPMSKKVVDLQIEGCLFKKKISFFWHWSKYERNGKKGATLILLAIHCVHTSMNVKK